MSSHPLTSVDLPAPAGALTEHDAPPGGDRFLERVDQSGAGQVPAGRPGWRDLGCSERRGGTGHHPMVGDGRGRRRGTDVPNRVHQLMPGVSRGPGFGWLAAGRGAHPGEMRGGVMPAHPGPPHDGYMSRPTRYEIEISGRATDRVLRPVIDDFRIEPTDAGTTVLTGQIRDASHLHGLLAHFTSLNVEVVELRRLDPDPPGPAAAISNNQLTSPEKGTQP